MKKYILTIISFLIFCGAFAQTNLNSDLLNWMNKDYKKDKVYGISLEKCYNELIRNKKPKKKVIVAVLDSGIDIEHEDLKNNIWINPNEIAANGIDDDNNGYIDDLHGWNFLGNSKGENINYENYEYVRLFKKLSNKFDEGKNKNISGKQKKEYKQYLKVKNTFQEEIQYKRDEKKQIDNIKQNLLYSFQTFENQIDINSFTIDALKDLTTENDDEVKIKAFLVRLFSSGFTLNDFHDLEKRNKEYLEKHLNLNFNPRSEIIGDDYSNIAEKNYGNNMVEGPRASHGTSVSGLIAAHRNNDLGINGVTNHVEIMVLRVVPNGDEYDKDIALAIRYAADNGAEIINMSFGKSYSPQKHLVDEAIIYASKKDVLFVHASGNDASNLDKYENYPTDKMLNGKTINNWISVGASSNDYLIAPFSNYGKKTVDIYAPGHKMICLDIDDNYETASGTSLAAPVVAGVAALLKAYFPKLQAADIKQIIMKSATNYKKELVTIPNENSETQKLKKFKKLSVSAGVLNAYDAFKMAKSYRKK